MKIKFETILVLVFLALNTVLVGNGQTPTPTASPNLQATPQANPTPTPITDPKAREFEEKLNYLFKLGNEVGKLVNSADFSERETGKLKADEVINLSKDLYERLETNEGLAGKVAPTVENAKNALQFLLKQVEINGYGFLTWFYRNNKDWLKVIESQRISIEITRETLNNSKLKTSEFYERAKYSLEFAEVTSFGNIASVYLFNLEKPDEALKYVDEGTWAVRGLQKQYKDNKQIFVLYKNREADFFDTKARIFNRLNKKSLAIENLLEALAIYQSLPNHEENQINILTSIGLGYGDQLDYENALKYYTQSLQIAEKIKDKNNETNTVALIGILYASLNNYEKANEMFQRNLKFISSSEYIESFKNKKLPVPFPEEWLKSAKNENPQLKFTDDQLKWLQNNELTVSYYGLKEYDKAIEYAKKSLQTVDSFNQPSLKQVTLILIAGAYREKEDWQNALIFYEAAAKISVNLSDKSNYGFDLSNLANAYLKTNQLKKAEETVLKALLIFQSLDAKKGNIFTGYSDTLNVLAQIHEAKGNRRLAIFYGKQTINAIQRERQQLKNLDRKSQGGYLQKNIKPYRRLIGWLIAANRIAEAEQVLQMLKEEELSDYLRRDDKVARELLAKIPPDSTEREPLQRFDAIADEISKIGMQVAELEKERNEFLKIYPSKDFPKQAELDRLENDLVASRTTFNRFLGELGSKYFNRQTKETGKRIEEISATQSLLKELNQPQTVIISTVIEDNRLNLIVTTSKINRAHTVDVSAEKLNELAVEFREALKDSKIDPRPLGKQLYDLLFPPAVQKDLAGVKADTIIWSLDGILRYIPMPALWDGNQYLVEKYNSGVITLTSRQNLKDRTIERNNLTVLGLGVSKKTVISDLDGTSKEFDELTAVPQELCSIVNDPLKAEICSKWNRGKTGVIGGTNLLDEEFTFRNFTLHLGRYPIVHIASHFALNPGNEGTSYLLLGGDGQTERKLTLVELKNKIGDKLGGTELLTLSACNTGMSAGVKASGEEVESFAAIAQKLGAKSVVSSLWAVADPSTRDLMTEFYRQLQTNPKISKAEALRLAQINLINGNYKTGDTPAWRGAELAGAKTNQQVAFKTDDNAPFAHPYYWSPFILIGNWR